MHTERNPENIARASKTTPLQLLSPVTECTFYVLSSRWKRPKTQPWGSDVVLTPSWLSTGLNPSRASLQTLNILAGGYRDLLVLQSPRRTSQVPLHIKPVNYHLERSAFCFSPSLPSVYRRQFAKQDSFIDDSYLFSHSSLVSSRVSWCSVKTNFLHHLFWLLCLMDFKKLMCYNPFHNYSFWCSDCSSCCVPLNVFISVSGFPHFLTQ